MAIRRNAGKRVLVVGGGIAGATVADRLCHAGAEVHLVEKHADIGGHVREMGCKAAGTCLRCNVCVADRTLRSVRRSSGISIHCATEMIRLDQGKTTRYKAILAPADGSSKGKNATVEVDTVVLATGHKPYDPIENSSFGYGRVPNVITGADAERQLSTQQRIVRASDGRPPNRVAFIQCVGSRTEEVFRRPEDTQYCSTVCCGYALRIARRIKHQTPDTAVTIFYMDIQNFGKGIDKFLAECRDKLRFIRSRPFEIVADADGAVRVKYAAEAGGSGSAASVNEESFDLVVLSVGIRPADETARMAELLGVAVDECGFLGLKNGAPLADLQRKGMFVVGSSESPKDIAGCMAQAEAVCAKVLSED